MKNKIDRTLIWFKNGNEKLLDLDYRFFGLSNLLNRLINEVYTGKRIQFINIDFSSEETYNLFPSIPMDYIHYYGGGGGHLRYYGVIDFNKFKVLSEYQQENFIWEKAFEYLQTAAKSIKNNSLIEASEYAYKFGLKIGLNPDFRVIQTIVNIYGQFFRASVWINFKKDGMYSKFTLEREEEIVFEKFIDKTKNGNEFFLEMYKSIEEKDGIITIKGHKDVDYLPLNIAIEKNLL